VILDHVEHIELPAAEEEEHYAAIQALARLGEGLFWAYGQVAAEEGLARARAAKDDVRVALVGGVLDPLPLGLLSCAFQWYAVSACNYAQLVGWLATRDTSSAKEYVRGVMPRLLNYRNKIAAHFAMTDPRRDNEADLVASVMTQIIFAHGRLCAAALSVTVDGVDGQEMKASRDFSWSLALQHERLIPRYWPAGPPKAYQALRVPPGEIKLNISWTDLLGNGA
jgi:hypothetical protein